MLLLVDRETMLLQELGRLRGSGGLTVGSNKTDIYVDHLNAESIEGNGMITLRANKVRAAVQSATRLSRVCVV